MPALNSGITAPEFTLPTIDGKQITLSASLRKGPVLLAFFKVSCPVCQYGFPFFERLYQAHRGENVTVLGISQDAPQEAEAFAQEFGVTFAIAVDDEAQSYAVSSAYGLTNVPTVFLISPSGAIEVSSVSWSRSEVEEINRKLASYGRHSAPPLWRTGEDIREFRAG
jgi:peroxiredoxin